MPEPRAPPAPTRLLAVPGPVAALFKRVPLAILPPNDLPLRSPSSVPDRETAILYIFTTAEGASRGAPSFNPSCLKWQTILKIAGLPITTALSTNHSSPTGALPFLLPPPSSTPSENLPIPAGTPLLDHAISHSSSANPSLQTPLSERQEAYLTLIQSQLRPAFLHALYLSKQNTRLLKSLYVDPSSSNTIVRAAIFRQVRRAAEFEVLKTTRRAFVDVEALYAGAKDVFSALETLLLAGKPNTSVSEPMFFYSSGDGEKECASPGLFDAEVFAYTNIILDEELGWQDRGLQEQLLRFPGLVEHRRCMLDVCFPDLRP